MSAPLCLVRRSFFALLLALLCFVAAATEINQANEAELDSVKGLGPSTTARILEARAQALFSDWADLMRRVKGIKPKQAAKLSEAGLRVNGRAFETAP
jgi:competence protein ComEA